MTVGSSEKFQRKEACDKRQLNGQSDDDYDDGGDDDDNDNNNNNNNNNSIY
jgi:hypothetical protein